MDGENEFVLYPTVKSIHDVLMETGRFPKWSLSTTKNILLGMNFRFKQKSEVDRAILIEQDYIIDWRIRYLCNLVQYRILGRPIHYCNETYIDPNAQPRKLLTDCNIQSAQQAEEIGLTTGLTWNSGRGNRLLILHMIGPDGLLKELERIWIRSDRKIQCEDYHNVSI